jgi:uncharacterized damage-inducible protein DinB
MRMKKIALTILFLSCVAATLQAQSAPSGAGNPTLAEVKQMYTGIKNNLTRMAEKMPAENYDFKPVAEIRTFGALMAHVADAQTRFCSLINGEAKTPNAGSKTSKDDIVAALKESFTECDKAVDGTTDANAFQMVSSGGRGQSSRLGLLIRFVIGHGNEEYGYGSIYLRLKGVVPPSSDTAGRGGR